MRKNIFLTALLLISGLGAMYAQSLNPLADGEYLTSKTEKMSVQGVPVPQKIECKVRSSSAEHVEIGFRSPNGRGYSYLNFDRLKDNVFAAKDQEGDFATPVRAFLKVKTADVMEVYYLNGEKADDFVVIAPKGSKFKTLKKEAKKNIGSFPAAGMIAEANAFNKDREADKLAAEKAREEERLAKEAAAKAARETARLEREAKAEANAAAAEAARSNADLCTPIAKYLKMGPANFKPLQGNLDAEETEMEEENVYFTSEVLPLFRLGRIIPSYVSDSKKNLIFETKRFYKKADAQTELEFIQARIDACYKNKAGFKYTLDSGMHMYKSSAFTISLMTKNAWDADDGDPKEYVLFQIVRR